MATEQKKSKLAEREKWILRSRIDCLIFNLNELKEGEHCALTFGQYKKLLDAERRWIEQIKKSLSNPLS